MSMFELWSRGGYEKFGNEISTSCSRGSCGSTTLIRDPLPAGLTVVIDTTIRRIECERDGCTSLQIGRAAQYQVA